MVVLALRMLFFRSLLSSLITNIVRVAILLLDLILSHILNIIWNSLEVWSFLKTNRPWLLVTFIILLYALPFANALIIDARQAPFSFRVSPKKPTAKPGDEVTFTIDITASSGFTDSITLVLEVEALSYYNIFDLGSQDPPFPKQFQYVVTVPEEVPASITMFGTLTASSMDHTVTEEVQIIIKSGNIVGNIVGLILGVFRAIGNWFSSLFGWFNARAMARAKLCECLHIRDGFNVWIIRFNIPNILVYNNIRVFIHSEWSPYWSYIAKLWSSWRIFGTSGFRSRFPWGYCCFNSFFPVVDVEDSSKSWLSVVLEIREDTPLGKYVFSARNIDGKRYQTTQLFEVFKN